MNIKEFKIIATKAFKILSSKNPLRIAGATAFFTTFSLPAILLIFIEVIGIFYNPNAVKQGIFTQLIAVIGKESSVKIYGILNQFIKLAQNWFAAAAGFLFLMFVVTTLFGVVRNSINELWNIDVERKPGLKFYVQLRLKSTLIICFAAIVLIAQLVATALQILLKDYIHEVWSGYNSFWYKLISQLIFVIVASGWFTILFRYLANAHPSWRTAGIGGVFTGILFTIGKAILSVLLTFNSLKEVFGKSGALVLILLFVFYCSFIFYYGAAFTKALSDKRNTKMMLDKHAFLYVVKKVKS
ncbi:MAG: YihY/virulence factor BrkB family protein [Parafilimonas sp.]